MGTSTTRAGVENPEARDSAAKGSRGLQALLTLFCGECGSVEYVGCRHIYLSHASYQDREGLGHPLGQQHHHAALVGLADNLTSHPVQVVIVAVFSRRTYVLRVLNLILNKDQATSFLPIRILDDGKQ